jgi:radical SAM protein with 4Fe4S-binding SPASM domain
MQKVNLRPQEVVWEITWACSMKCLHCGTSAGKKRPDELTTDEALNLIDELVSLGSEHITLSGGEPLLRDDWRLLAERIVKNGAVVSLITNGLAVTEEVADDFERIGFGTIGVSFDGTEKTHNYIRQRSDSYDKALGAIKILGKRNNLNACAVTQVSNLNLNELFDIRKLLIDAGCKIWRIQMTTPTGRMQEHRDLILTLDNYPHLVDTILEMQKMGGIVVDVGENIGYFGCKGSKLREDGVYMGCFAGTYVAGIESNGNVKGCLSMPEEYVEGNIRDSSFTEIWNRPGAFAYNRQFTKETGEGGCHDCKYLILCRGGCANTSISATGKRADNPYCMHRVEQGLGITCEDSDEVRKGLEMVRQMIGAEKENN